MNAKWDVALTITLVACAVITTGLVIRRELLAPVGPSSPPVSKPTLIENWQSHLAAGVRLGPANAPVQLIEFADFECPYCASLHRTLATVRDRYPEQVALYFVHFPLPGHRFAEPATRVAECADEQGAFERMHNLLFEQQARLGLKPWRDFAAEAGVANLSAFESCIKETGPIPRVLDGRKLGEQLDVKGTPTLIINGWRLGRPPNADELDAMIKAVLAGEDPV